MKMDSYVLIMAGKGLKTETTSDDYYQSLFKGFCLALEQFQRLSRRKGYQSFGERINNEDPFISMLQKKANLNVAISCSYSLESLLEFPDIINTSSWLSFDKTREERDQLNDGLEELRGMLQRNYGVAFGPKETGCSADAAHISQDEKIDSDDDDDDDGDDDDNLADHLHQLTNLLPMKGDAIVQVYWILPDCQQLNVSNTLSLFGSLKRLQECHNAFIEIVSSVPNLLTGSFLDTWRKWLMFSIRKIDSWIARDIPLWCGSLDYMGHQRKKLISLPGFALTYYSDSDRKYCLEQDEARMDSSNVEPAPWHLSDIQLLHFTPKNSIPLFLFLPYKLNLHLLYESDFNMTQVLLRLHDAFAKGLCLLACVLMKPRSEQASKASLDSWMEFVTSSTDKRQPQDCVDSKKRDLCRRLCVIDLDLQENLCVYPLWQSESIKGDIYERLENMTRGKQIVDNTQKDNQLYLKDLSDNLLSDQKEKDIHYFKEVHSQIEMLTSNGNESITDLNICEIMCSVNEKTCPNISSKNLDSPKCFHLDLSLSSTTENRQSLAAEEIACRPKLCRERLWLIHQDSHKLHARKRPLSVPVDEIMSLSVKDILKRFRPDGKPVKVKLSPLRCTGKSFSENYINTTEAAIQETSYPESLTKRFHGVEYCLDSSWSLIKDNQISQTQNHVVKQETLSLSSELIPRAFPKKTKNSTGNTQTGNKTSKAREEKQQQQLRKKRTIKRKSPQINHSSKRAKRKCKDSATNNEEASQELSKPKETRSQRHKRRLRLVVNKTLEDNGIGHGHSLYSSCSERLYSLIKSFLKDLKSSHGLNDTMKELAHSNVEQVINFEKTRHSLQEKKRAKLRDKSDC